MRFFSLLLALSTCFVFSQNPYPQDYFRNPLDIPIVLAGTFGELRSNHFHSGLDIKTQQRVGLKVYTAAEGYVSRIKVSTFGYGKALYITHPNGYTTVYAHLKDYSDKIESYVKNAQYDKQSFHIELFPTPDELPISANELVAFSGNTGGSAGPHLHFEIRDKKEHPMNPMLFGMDVPDTRRPTILKVFVYPADEHSYVNHANKRRELRLIPQENGDYKAEPIQAYGKIGFGVVTHDKLDGAYNKNGVSNIKSFFNGSKILEIDFKRFSFDETKHLNRLIDYEYFKNNKSRIQKLFIEPNNPLSLYKDPDNNGYIQVEDSTSSVYRVRIKDFKNNEAWLTIPIEGKKDANYQPKSSEKTEYYVYHDQSSTLSGENVEVDFPSHTFYDDFYIDFRVSNDTLYLHQSTIPAQKNFFINWDISHYTGEDKDKLYIASVSKYGKIYYSSTQKKGNVLTCGTKNLGTYTLATDTINPTIKPMNFQNGKWVSKQRYLKLKIDDEHSGVKSYRGTINGKWILMEYDYKKNTLIYDFTDNIISESENNLKVIVTDNVGNSSTFEAIFFRK